MDSSLGGEAQRRPASNFGPFVGFAMVIGLSMDSVKKRLEFLGERALSSMSYSVTNDILVHSPHVLLVMLVVRYR